MSIFVIGINYRSAPIEFREKAYFTQDKVALYLQDLIARDLAREVVIISTCNRTELYCEADDANAICAWFCAQFALDKTELQSLMYIYYGETAVAHIMHVACGLDSMILGEPQILGQMKDAFSESCTMGAIGVLFQQLFQHVFAIAKEIRTTTTIGACPVSVASAAIYFAKQLIPVFSGANVVLIGAGKTGELLLRYLSGCKPQSISLVNRNINKALDLALRFGSKAYGLDQLAEILPQADLVLSATGSVLPIINYELMEMMMHKRHGREINLIDIAVPRDIDPSVGTIEGVILHCIDDLKMLIENNLQGREHAAEKAKEMINKKSIELMLHYQTNDKVKHTIKAYRGQIEEICNLELQKAKQRLQQGANPALVLESFAHAYTQKLLHTPSVQLRQAGIEGRFELLRLANQLFAIADPEVERL